MQRLKIFIFIILAGQWVAAQDFKYGVTGNVLRSSIVEVHDRSKGKWAGSIGFFGQWPLVENDIYDSAWLYFTPQIEYSMLGEIADANPAKFSKQKYFNDYITLQAYIKYFFHNGNYKYDYFVFAGPKAEFLVRESKKVPEGYDEVYYKFNRDDVVNSIGIGASAGIGMRVSDYAEIFLRYDRGFSKVYKNNTTRNTANQMIALGFSYYLSRF